MTQSAYAAFDPDEGIMSMLDIYGTDLTLDYLQATPDCVKLIDPNGRVVFMSRNGMKAMAIQAHEHVAGQVWADLWPDKMSHTVRAVVAAGFRGQTSLFRGLCPTAQGAVRYWEVSVSPVFDASGAVKMLVSNSTDITDRLDS